MVTIDVLKRKDAASLIVGIVVAFIIVQSIGALSSMLVTKIGFLRGSYGGSPDGSIGQYLLPIVEALVSLGLLELVARIYIYAASQFTTNKK